MKAVLDQTPFPPLRLSRADCQRFEKLARDILRNVLSEYDHFGAPANGREFSKRRWKVVKSHEHCTVYLDRNSKRVSSQSTHSYNSSNEYEMSDIAMADPVVDGSDENAIDAENEGADWKMPELVVSGTVPGTLADVLYGMTTHDSADLMLRTAYVDDSWLDAAVLHQIQGPTPEDPFRFLGIKWYIKGIPKQYQALVRPRDFVFLEASGTLTRADGSRVGYFLRHAVDLPGCGELSRHGITRGRLISYSIYTPLDNLNAVDIFVRGKAEPNGAQALVIQISANSLLSSSNAVMCSQSKKLTWLLRTAAKNKSSATTATRCNVCTRKFGMLSSIATCSICCETVCSRCRVNRSLSFVVSASGSYKRHLDGLTVEQVPGTFCKTCIASANASSAFDIAQSEVLSGRYGPVQEATRQPTRSQAQTPPKPETTSERTSKTSPEEEGSPSEGSSIPDSESTGASPSTGGLRDDWEPAIPENEDEGRQHAGSSGDANQQRQELWRKMAELRQQAEDSYLLTKKMTELHLQGSKDQYDSDAEEL